MFTWTHTSSKRAGLGNVVQDCSLVNSSVRPNHRVGLFPAICLVALLQNFAGATAAAVDYVDGNLILFNDNGAWSWYQDERAIVDQKTGRLLISSVAASLRFDKDSRDGNVDLITFDLASGKRTRFVLGEIQEDDHNVAALLKRPDGRYLAVYTNHNTDRVSRYRVSVNPEDTSQWTPERQFNWRETPGNDFNVTYSNVFYLKAENKVYNFARVNDRSPNMMLSTDQGDTWRYGGQLTQSENVGYVNGYFKYASNGHDRIHLIATQAHPRDYNNGIYHAYIQRGRLFGSDGALIDDTIHDNEDIPATNSLTPVFIPDQEDGSQQRHRAWTTDLALDKTGLPYALFTTRAGDARPSRDGRDDDRRLYYARYDGERWAYHEVAKMGRRLFRSEQDYTGLGALVPGDPNTIYISTTIHPGTQEETPFHEIYRGVTKGDGRDWQWMAVTRQSSVDNLRPLIPQWSRDKLAVLWFRGQMRRSQRYDCAIVGVIDRAGDAPGKIHYVDADKENTKLAKERPVDTANGSSEADIAGWRFLADFGNDGVFSARESEGDGAPMLKTQIADLDRGTYDLFAFFWGNADEDWLLKAGLSPEGTLSFRRMACQAAEPDQFHPDQTVAVADDAFSLYRSYVGRIRVKDGDTVTVYLDDDSSARQRPTRYDGIGYGRVETK